MNQETSINDKITILVFAGLALIVGLIVVGSLAKSIVKGAREEALVQANEKACQELSLVYGDKVKVINGFYKGQAGTVIDRTRYSDGTAMKLDLDTDNRSETVSVKCEDLARWVSQNQKRNRY